MENLPPILNICSGSSTSLNEIFNFLKNIYPNLVIEQNENYLHDNTNCKISNKLLLKIIGTYEFMPILKGIKKYMISKEDKILIIAFHANDKRDNSLVAGLRPYYLHRFFVRKKCNVKLFHRFNTNNNTKECNLYPVDGLFWWSIISFFKLKKRLKILML